MCWVIKKQTRNKYQTWHDKNEANDDINDENIPFQTACEQIHSKQLDSNHFIAAF